MNTVLYVLNSLLTTFIWLAMPLYLSSCKQKVVPQIDYVSATYVVNIPFFYIDRYSLLFSGLPDLSADSIVIFNQPKDTSVLFYALEYIYHKDIGQGDTIDLLYDPICTKKNPKVDSGSFIFRDPKMGFPFDEYFLSQKYGRKDFFEKYELLNRNIIKEFPYTNIKDFYYCILSSDRLFSNQIQFNISLDNSFSFTGDYFYGRINYLCKSEKRSHYILISTERFKKAKLKTYY